MDTIPFSLLKTQSKLNIFCESLKFKEVEIAEDKQKDIVLLRMKTGEFRVDDKVFPVDLFQISVNRLIFRIKGDSAIAERFYSQDRR